MSRRVPLVPLHGPSLRGRARADAGLLAVTAVLLALAALVAVVVPRQVDADADRTVRAALRADADRAAVTVQVQLGASAGEVGVTASTVSAAAQAQTAAVDAAVPGLVGPPVAVLTVPRLDAVLARGEQGLTSLRVAHVWRGGGASGVRWVAGAAAGPPPDGADVSGQTAPPPLRVGLAEPVASALGVGVGDVVPAALGDGSGVGVDLVVSGVFTAVDPADPVWDAVPGLLAPDVTGSGASTATELAALVDDAQVPVLVAQPVALPVLTTSLPVRPTAVTASGAERTARRLAALEAAPASQLPGLGGAGARLSTGADDVLREASARVAHLRAQASVLLRALAATTAALVVVAAGLLAQRRAAGLAVLRARGAPLVSTAAEAALEAAAVTVLAAAVGALAGALVLRAQGLAAPAVPGLALVAPLAGLAVAAHAAAAVAVVTRREGALVGRGRHGSSPGSRGTSGRWGSRGRALTAEAAAVLLAVLALVSLLQTPSTTTGAPSGPLVAAALPLVAVAVALLGRRASLPLLQPVRRAAVVRRGAVPLLAVSGLEAAARRAPALVAVSLACAGASASVVVRVSLTGAAATDPRTAPAVQGLQHLAVAAAVVLALLGVLAVVLDAAASAPARRTAAAASAVLGLPPTARRGAALGELVPAALAASTVGCLTGAVAGLVLRSPLGLPGPAAGSGAALVLVGAPVALVVVAAVLAAGSGALAPRSVP